MFKCFIDKTNILCRCVQPRDITAGAILVVRTLITHKSKTKQETRFGQIPLCNLVDFLNIEIPTLLLPTTEPEHETSCSGAVAGSVGLGQQVTNIVTSS